MSPSQFRRTVASALFLSLGGAVAPAQQPNVPTAALSVNGTGRIDPSTGLVAPSNSQVIPPTPGGAPLYRHRTLPGTALEIRVQGTPGQPVILVLGNPQAPAASPLGFLEIALPNMAVVVDGLSPFVNFLNAGAFIGPNGAWTLIAGGGLPVGMPDFHLQGAVGDPTFPPYFIRLTGSVTVETRNDVETLDKNFVDAYGLFSENPLYGLSLCSSNFNWNGRSPVPFFSENGGGEHLTLTASLPNTLAAGAALPVGGPTAGQSVAHAVEVQFPSPAPCPGLAVMDLDRTYDLTAKEQGGVWKMAGTGRDAEVFATVRYAATPAAPTAAFLDFEVCDDCARGGVGSVTLSGPQLSGLNVGTMVATSSATGTVTLPGSGGCCWFASVQVGAAGSSRFPLVDDATGPRDAYTMTIAWNDATTSGPYTLVARGAIDGFAAPGAVVAATPGAPTGVLTNAGTPSASLALTFAVGAMPSPSIWSSVDVQLFQGGSEYEFEALLLPASPAAQTVTLCVPGLAAGVPTFVVIGRDDLFRAKYQRHVSLIF